MDTVADTCPVVPLKEQLLMVSLPVSVGMDWLKPISELELLI